ncbi:MAG TPA: DUF4252 domain-containing protein [Bacteroidales bacterium]|jgi:hypothetical protein|nr:DUF4252 domain-containing protein [Bacteroidales bacterium]
MKSLILAFAFLFYSAIAAAQSGAVDQMFEKYSEKEGFTVVSISSKMFSMLAELDSDNENADDIIHNLNSIKILSVKDSLMNKGINFYTELMKKIDPKSYEELMVVKEGQEITKFLVKYKGERIAELLVISGGPRGNSLISIKGSLSLKNLSSLSRSMDIKELENLEKVEKKNP